MSDILVARCLAKTYARRGASGLEVLRDLDLSVAPGERVAVRGESGVGKSTLLNLLGGLDRPDGFRMADATKSPDGATLGIGRRARIQEGSFLQGGDETPGPP